MRSLLRRLLRLLVLAVQAAERVFYGRYHHPSGGMPFIYRLGRRRRLPEAHEAREPALVQTSGRFLPSSRELFDIGIASLQTWHILPSAVEGPIAAARLPASRRCVWCLFDLACALAAAREQQRQHSSPSAARVRTLYLAALARSDDSDTEEGEGDDDGAWLHPALEGCAAVLEATTTDFPAPQVAAGALVVLRSGPAGADATRRVLRHLAPVLTAASLRLPPTPTLRRRPR